MNEVRNLDLRVVDDQYGTVIEVGLLATLYFEGADSPAVRNAVIDCLERYQALVGPNLRWTKHPSTYHFLPATDSRIPSPAESFRDMEPGDPWEFAYRGGETADQATGYMIEALGSRPGEGDLSYLRVAFPLLWFAEHGGHFYDVLLDFCQRLKPVHGYGGLGILESPNRSIKQRFEPMVYTMAQRFPGLEVDAPTAHAIYLVNGIKGVNWLTVLGDEWLDKVGGPSALEQKLDSSFIIYRYASGLIIEAGPVPQLGDKEAHNMPAQYVKLSSVLKPIRVRQHRAFQNAGPGVRFDRTRSEEWLKRFG
jgi:hypothetical protein